MLRDRTARPSYDVQGIRIRECHRALGFDSPRSTSSCSRRTQHANDNALDDHDDCTAGDMVQLPPLPTNEALAQVVSQVQIEMDGWAPLHIFKLFLVLVEPPPGLDLSAVEGLPNYLSELLVLMGTLQDNGIRQIATHCCWVLIGKCHTPHISLL